MSKMNLCTWTAASVVDAAIFLQSPLTRAEDMTGIDNMPTPDFLARCDSDKTTWCFGRRVNVAIATTLDQITADRLHTVCLPDQGKTPVKE